MAAVELTCLGKFYEVLLGYYSTTLWFLRHSGLLRLNFAVTSLEVIRIFTIGRVWVPISIPLYFVTNILSCTVFEIFYVE